jgi:hypothetical protein
VLNGNEIAIDRATPKERTSLLPGRLSMSQPNLQLAGGSGSGEDVPTIVAQARQAAASAAMHPWPLPVVVSACPPPRGGPT